MTLSNTQNEAYMAGWHDANKGRVYRDSFDPGSQLRVMELHDHYEAGWVDSRAHKQPPLCRIV